MPDAIDYGSWVQHTWTFPSGYGNLNYTVTFHSPPIYKPLLDATYATITEAAKLPGFNFLKVVVAFIKLVSDFTTNPAAIPADFAALIAAITGP